MATTPSVKSEYHLDPADGQRYTMMKPGGTTDPSGNPAGNMVNHNMSDWRGNYATTWWLSGTVVSVGAATLYTSGDVSMYNHMTLQLSGTGVETTTISASIDGGTTFTALILYDANTGALAADGTGLTSNGLYYLDGKYDAINIVQAGVGTPTVSWAHSVI